MRAALDLTEPVRQGSSLQNRLATADPTLPGSQREPGRSSADDTPAVRLSPVSYITELQASRRGGDRHCFKPSLIRKQLCVGPRQHPEHERPARFCWSRACTYTRYNFFCLQNGAL